LSIDGQTSESTLKRTNAVHVHGVAELCNVVHDDAIAQLGEALQWLDLAYHALLDKDMVRLKKLQIPN
jgi:hypothetical protein